MKNLLKNIAIGILIFLILSTIFSYFWSGTEMNQKQAVSLNELALKVKNGEIKNMVVSDPEVRAITQDDKILVTNKETGVSIIETLKNLGVTEDDLAKVQIEIKTTSDWLLWGALILQTILPLALIFIFFMWMNKQAQKSVG